MTREHSDRLAETIQVSAGDLIAELQAVRDGVEELYVLLDHIWRNREELQDILSGLREENAERDDEIIACCHCDASASLSCHRHTRGLEGPPVRRRPGLELPRRLPELRQAAGRSRPAAGKHGPRNGADAGQIQRAQAEGVTTELGLRRIEKNSRADEIPETIACARCDADSPASLAAALQEGWTDLCRDDGAAWNYLGVCPDCQAQEIETAEPEGPPPDPQKHLFG